MTMFKSILTMAAVLAMSIQAQAGLFGNHGCGAEKSCGCSDDCAPACCKPVIVRPCGPNIYTYQRACSNIKPPSCCDNGCPATCCAPSDKCVTDPGCAAPADPSCCPDPTCAAPCDPGCAAPVDPGCQAPCDPACGAPAACSAPACAPSCHSGLCGGKKWFKGGLFKKFGHGLGHGCGNDCCEDPCCEDPGCAAPADPGCAAPCDPGCGDECVEACEDPCAKYDPCKLACLIYESQTACYARDRACAINKIGNRYNCKCNPEIITAFIYALNDADHRVRRQAADEIGDQTRKYGCCCTPEVVSALTCTLADCDRSVRRNAERALKLCGYEIVDGCCEESCCEEPACAAPACGAPAAGCNASYFPARLHNSVAQPVASKSSLSNLFGMTN